MIRQALSIALGCCSLLWTSTAAAQFQYVQYRGMAPGWPNQASGNYTAYYAPGYGQPMYYVARPTTGAYANPGYFGAYNVAPVTAQRPVTAAYYAPQYSQQYAQQYYSQQYAPQYYSQQYAPQYSQPGTTAYYAPAQAQYGAANSYSVSPAGGSTAGAEAYSHYGQPTTVNYVPPRFTYRTNYAAVPVYMYRPVTAYQPGTGQPVTCLQPVTTTQCQPQRARTHSWFSHSWFNWGRSSCGSGGCGAPPPTTAYCQPATTCNYPQPCGQPYYPTQPGIVIPAVPAQPGTIYTPLPPAGSTVPPPPTRIVPGPGGSFSPADTRPSLSPPAGSGGFVPRPSPTIVSPPAGSGSFSTDPSATPGGTIVPSPATPLFNPGTGSGYAPVTDPYSNSSTSIAPIRAPQLRAEASQPTIQEPAGPKLAPGVQTVPDPEAHQAPRPINRAPQLIDPRDKTAQATKIERGDQRWAVVPAVWPKSETAVAPAPAESPYRVYQERSLDDSQRTTAKPVVNPADYDDSGWASSR